MVLMLLLDLEGRGTAPLHDLRGRSISPSIRTHPNYNYSHASAYEFTTSTQSIMAGAESPKGEPSLLRYVLGFLAVGIAWGLTTPFMRKAAINHNAPSRPELDDENVRFAKRKILSVWYSVFDLARRPAYFIPLLLNLSGSVWFFLMVGQAGK